MEQYLGDEAMPHCKICRAAHTPRSRSNGW